MPVNLLALQRILPQRYPYLLQSVAHGTPQSRYDILFAFPGECLTLHTDGWIKEGEPAAETDFLRALDSWWQRTRMERAPRTEQMPFRGGWFVFLGYELAVQIEPILRLPRGHMPIAWAVRVPAAVIHDHFTGITTLLAEADQWELVDQLATDIHNLTDQPVWHGDLLALPLIEEDANGISTVWQVRENTSTMATFSRSICRACGGRSCMLRCPRRRSTAGCGKPIQHRLQGWHCMTIMPSLVHRLSD